LLQLAFYSASNWWEPGTPNAFDIGDLGAILAALLAGSAIFMGVTKVWMKLLRSVIREEIVEATKPIHPSANGGLSLADVARKTNKLEEHLVQIQKENSETKDLLIKVLATSVIIPDLPPAKEETPLRRKPRKSN
jgi:hypothetical protein